MNAPLRHQVADVLRARLLTSLLDTATVLTVVRLASKEAFGVLQLLLVLYEVGRYVVTLGLPDSLYYFFAKLPAQQTRALSLRTFGLLAVGGLLLGGVLAALGLTVPTWLPNWSETAQAEVTAGLPLLALVAAIELPTWAVYPLLVASGRGRVAGVFEVVTSLGGMAALVVPLSLGGGVHAVLQGLLAYAVGRLGLSVWMLASRLPPAGEALPASFLREQLRYAVPLGLNTVVGRLNKYTDKLIVGGLLAERALAEYGVASTEVPFVTVFPYAIGSVLIPQYVRLLHAQHHAQARALWLRAARRVSLLVIPAGIFVIANAPDLVVLFAGEGYRAAALPFALVATLLLHRVVQYGGMLQALGDTTAILRITIVVVVLNAVLSLPLTYALGTTGAAVGTVVAQWLGWLIYLRRIGVGLQVRPRAVLPFAQMLEVAGVAALAAAAAGLLRHTWAADTPTVPAVLLSVVVFLVGYLGIGTALRVIDRGAWASLRLLLLGGAPRRAPGPRADGRSDGG